MAPGTIIEAWANVRSGPGPDYEVLSVVAADDSFQVVGRNRDGNWLQICCLGEGTGWVFAELMTVEGDAGMLPEVPASSIQ